MNHRDKFSPLVPKQHSYITFLDMVNKHCLLHFCPFLAKFSKGTFLMIGIFFFFVLFLNTMDGGKH